MGISTHILDTSQGRPVPGVPVSLVRFEQGVRVVLAEHTTDADGRCRQLLPDNVALETGLYQIHFETVEYYRAQGITGLYPYIEIAFEVQDPQQHYHIPLLLTANGYTTYRGS
jgi:5-hydroxyisourate hydrolase